MSYLPSRQSCDRQGGIQLGPLRCYIKDTETGAVLAASKRPTKLCPNGPDPLTVLPPSAMVSWVWRAAKCQAVGRDVSAFHFLEVPEIAQCREMSTRSTRNCEKRLQEIRDAAKAEEWRQRVWASLEAEQRHHEEQQRHRAEGWANLAYLLEARKN